MWLAAAAVCLHVKTHNFDIQPSSHISLEGPFASDLHMPSVVDVQFAKRQHEAFFHVTVKATFNTIFLLFFFFLLGPPESSCGRNLDDLIQSLGAASLSVDEAPAEKVKGLEEPEVKAVAQDEEVKELEPEESDGEEEDEEEKEEEEEELEEEEEGVEESELLPSLEEEEERQVEEEEEEDVTNIEELVAGEPASGLRRRNRPE